MCTCGDEEHFILAASRYFCKQNGNDTLGWCTCNGSLWINNQRDVPWGKIKQNQKEKSERRKNKDGAEKRASEREKDKIKAD